MGPGAWGRWGASVCTGAPTCEGICSRSTLLGVGCRRQPLPGPWKCIRKLRGRAGDLRLVAAVAHWVEGCRAGALLPHPPRYLRLAHKDVFQRAAWATQPPPLTTTPGRASQDEPCPGWVWVIPALYEPLSEAGRIGQGPGWSPWEHFRCSLGRLAGTLERRRRKGIQEGKAGRGRGAGSQRPPDGVWAPSRPASRRYAAAHHWATVPRWRKSQAQSSTPPFCCTDA